MFELLNYLNEHHRPGIWFDYSIANDKKDWSFDKHLGNDFQTKFGVKVKPEHIDMPQYSPGNLYLFKYGIIDSNWKDKITHQCRGTIMRHGDDGWKCMSRPFDKFFNQHEGYCPIFEEEEFNKSVSDLYIAEKADGSCIQLWHDDDVWRVSTLGMINTALVQEENVTFEELFWNTVSIQKEKLDKNVTYLFELCCDENRIVTRYKLNHAVLLAARYRDTGRHLNNLDGVLMLCLNVRLASKVSCKDLGLTSLKDVKKYVESESETEEKYGEYPEGFALYNSSGCPIAKIKNSRYVSLHRVGGGDIKQSKNIIIDSVFLGHIDDVYDVLSPRLKEFADGIKNKASLLIADTKKCIDDLSVRHFSDRKEFAIVVQQSVRKEVCGFFFKNADHFLEKKNDNIVEDFESWLTEHYQRFDFLWGCCG